MRRCVIFGGGELKDIRFTQSLLREDDYIVCADRGYAYCAAMGRKPDLILGDFDSYSGKLPPGCEVLRYPIEKDDTDTMLAVKEAIRREFADILMLGCWEGGWTTPWQTSRQSSMRCSMGPRPASSRRTAASPPCAAGRARQFPMRGAFTFRCSATATAPRGSASATLSTSWRMRRAQTVSPSGQQLFPAGGGCGDQRGERHFGDCGEHGKVKRTKTSLPA